MFLSLAIKQQNTPTKQHVLSKLNTIEMENRKFIPTVDGIGRGILQKGKVQKKFKLLDSENDLSSSGTQESQLNLLRWTRKVVDWFQAWRLPVLADLPAFWPAYSEHRNRICFRSIGILCWHEILCSQTTCSSCPNTHPAAWSCLEIRVLEIPSNCVAVSALGQGAEGFGFRFFWNKMFHE